MELQYILLFFTFMCYVPLVYSEFRVLRKKGLILNSLFFYYLLWGLEFFGGFGKAVILGNKAVENNPLLAYTPDIILNAQLILTVSFFLVVIGYKFSNFLFSILYRRKSKLVNTNIKLTIIHFIVFLIITVCSFVSIINKIINYGGIVVFLNEFYSNRFGIKTEDENTTSLIVLANLIGSAIIAFYYKFYVHKITSTKSRKVYFYIATFLLIASVLAQAFRTTMILTIVGLMLLRYDIFKKKLSFSKLSLVAIPLALLIGIYHRFMYFLTGGAESAEDAALDKVILEFMTPHGHFESVSSIYMASTKSAYLNFETIWDNVLFWIPRGFYLSKSSNYGTMIVQEWAGLPTWFQIAVTFPGELFAHYGFFALLFSILYGFVFRLLDNYLYSTNYNYKYIYYGLVMPRLFAIISMGMIGVTITFFQLFLCSIIIKLGDKKNI